ncbi:MAG: glycerophosphodiester phosphodiesterase family protein [Chitinophagaceae bacterium]|nr:glycerophosphodiester phosphodiesterase family protein [Chitinophagaceae bacterium]
MKKILVLSLLAVFALRSLTGFAQKKNAFNFRTSKALQAFFHYTGQPHPPIISGHRGGMVIGFPENSIATFVNTLKYTPAFYEIDPRLTKDSVVVLMHDATLDRTTTGKGKVSDYTYRELQQLFLKDKEGNITPYRIPTLLEALKWSRGKTVLNLDHKGVPFEMIADIIKQGRNPAVMLTIHSPEQAQFYLDRDPNSMFSVHILTREAFEKYEAAHIPWKSMIAYIGPKLTDENRELLGLLHEKGVMCMVSAAPTFDKLPDSAERAQHYREIFKNGVDILESDLPIEVAEAIKVVQ